ncbi:MAG: glycosyltransferase [Faecalibacterium sp.]|jgi:glycosyltransferase involved in cell wall biosynthesis|nr:glycosyltransferase [Faecalibacterium sp.]
MKISIVIPVYRVEKYLDACVESVVAQTYADWEAILVDDGSPDACGALCDAWAAKDARIHTIHRQNGGLSAARNTGIDAAKGEYVLLLDSDDWLVPQALMTLVQAAEAGSDLVLFDYARFADDGAPLPPEHENVPAGTYTADEALALFAENRISLITAWTKLYRRALFGQVRFPEGVLNEDEFTVHRFLAACKQITALEAPLYCYRNRPGSIMNALSPYKAAYVLHAFAERIALLRQRGLTAAVKKQELNFYRIYRYRYPPLSCGGAAEKARAADIRALYKAVYSGLMADGVLSGADRAKAFALRYCPDVYCRVYNTVFKEQSQ